MSSHRAAVPALLGFLCGLAGEGLLFIHCHCRAVEDQLASDFRLVAFLEHPLEAPARMAVENGLKGLEGIDSVAFVAGSDALGRLAKSQPELVQSAPREPLLPDAFEIRLRPEILGRLGGLVQRAEAIKGIEEVRFKPLEAGAWLQVRFYSRFLAVLAGIAWFALAAGAAAACRRALRSGWKPQPFGFGAAGALSGAGLGLALAFPMRQIVPLWALPAAWAQLALLTSGGLLAWIAAEG